ncbi:MAG: large conductance mechanosensitive channel protein MscL [Acidimicrobiia bacterium]|nr:large conductance mechanosensitive channel protein MscL [Acidimicrobiia bacterium]
MLEDFKNFLLRGNVVDLAVAVVIGVAFGAVVTSFVDDILTPIVTIPGETNFADLDVTVGGAVIRYGLFLNALVAFVLIATAVFFLVVRPVGALVERRRAREESTTRECPECLSEIPRAATRCAHCTAAVPALA